LIQGRQLVACGELQNENVKAFTLRFLETDCCYQQMQKSLPEIAQVFRKAMWTGLIWLRIGTGGELL
jgi:hypothetical protein